MLSLKVMSVIFQISRSLIVAVGGVWVLMFLVRVLFTIFRNGSIDRKKGLKPFTSQDNPAIFWAIIAWVFLGAVGIAFGKAFSVIDLINLLQ